MKPYVSILVPIYKVPERYLRKCVESCSNQTLKNIEIILVDDGSPDNCGSICDEYAEKDERIKVIHKKNEGLAAARNSAFDISVGEYITFLDGDDYLDVATCEKVYAKAKEKNVQMVLWDVTTEYPNSSRIGHSFGKKELEFRGDECRKLQARVLDFNGRIAQAFCKLINREFLVQHKIRHNDDLKQGAEGLIFNIALFEYVNTVYYLPEPLLHYMYNDQSISHSPSEENYYMIIRCFEYIEQFIQKSSNKELLEKNLYNRLLYVIVTTGITGYFNPANTDLYKRKVEKYKKFLKEPLLVKAMDCADYEGVSIQRKFILKCVQLKQFWIIAILGKIRRKQLAKR